MWRVTFEVVCKYLLYQCFEKAWEHAKHVQIVRQKELNLIRQGIDAVVFLKKGHVL
jgi:hypothetical protein